MSILILFQSFKVLDEILHHGEGEVKKGYIIIEEAESETELTQKPAKEVEEINFKDLFSNASLDNGKKISKQCVACHSFDNGLNWWFTSCFTRLYFCTINLHIILI